MKTIELTDEQHADLCSLVEVRIYELAYSVLRLYGESEGAIGVIYGFSRVREYKALSSLCTALGIGFWAHFETAMGRNYVMQDEWISFAKKLFKVPEDSCGQEGSGSDW